LDTDLRCVIVGNAPYSEAYIASLKTMATSDPRIIFTGYVFGDGYHELGSNAYAFVETSEVGGTHPALVEAMALNNCVIVNDTAENLETVGSAGLWYHGEEGAESLRQVLADLIANPDRVADYRRRALEWVRQRYTWDVVTDTYEALFTRLLEQRPKSNIRYNS